MHDLRSALGARIRTLRTERGLSQEELASRAKLHWTYLSDLERGQQTPSLDLLNRIVRGLGVTLADFFAPFDRPFRGRFRKPRHDLSRQ